MNTAVSQNEQLEDLSPGLEPSLRGPRGLSVEFSLSKDAQALSPLNVWNLRPTRPIPCKAPGEGKRHRRLVGMHVMGWTSDLTSKHGTHGKGMKERDTRQGGTTNREACLGGVEIPTIIIFQIQRLLVSEQRNNKFNQRWSLKERK